MPWTLLTLFLVAAMIRPVGAQEPANAHPAASLGLLETIPWQRDGAEFFDHAPAKAAKADRTALIDGACARAKSEGKLVLWYVHRIEEKKLGGRQMYRAPVLDIYMQQVVFADADVASMAGEAFVPVRCMLDETLAQRFHLRPLEFVEPAVVFLDGDGKVVHFVERIRTFQAQWFADLMARILEQHQVPRKGDSPQAMRRLGLWRPALAMLQAKTDKSPSDWLEIAQLQRLLRQPEAALTSLDQADAIAAAKVDPEKPRRGPARAAAGAIAFDIACERGLVLAMSGRTLEAQPYLEFAWRGNGTRTAEAG